ncbi:MAG: DedA family protein [Candidatus Wildermuthbacteria bacterium]|nr:DedA family protein [Candidatus Wildermuthbacteria bacterium]
MVYDLLTILSGWVIDFISSAGYWGIFVLMLMESALIPIPSEIIMPFSGFLVWSEKLSWWPVILWGTIGNLVGSIIAYFVGRHGGRALVLKYGKYVLVSADDVERAEKWFNKYGSISIFFSRLLPVVRTFISLPAGIARMSLWKFSLYTFLGSLPWSILLTYLGIISGENWKNLEVYFRKFDWAILILIILTVAWYLYAKFVNHSSSR